MRKLASIRKISKIKPIKGKDKVELAVVDGWTCMVSKDDGFKAGDLCIFCEPDSVFPKTKQWEFLKKYNYRIKTQKFKDGDGNPIYSQGLVLQIKSAKVNKNVKLGDDVTNQLGIIQYKPTMDKEDIKINSKYPKFLMRYKLFIKLILKDNGKKKFPKFINKSDEERIQNIPQILDEETKWIATEKIDGQSGTFCVVKHKFLFWTKYEFIVCSRNFVLSEDNSSYWYIANRYNIKKKLTEYIKKHKNLNWVAIQGECIAPKIQKNKYNVDKPDLYVFNFITSHEDRFDSKTARTIISEMGMKFVPFIEEKPISLKGKSVDDVIKMSNGKSALLDVLREGIVFRSTDGKLSFKAVSPEFLIKHNE